ncbi:hypothetical protein LTR70_006069 [Exophiala xenobiotica]|uniref:DUF7580 domain-containing protein n=1 Tax=Lithohypha guttulata TaxID=1690604 RepID=A0ABR0KGH4_9EURO|nr:hypothetical protein LTR24_003274 [Lithohypha guttulata]KAK5316936.1 hypothetical protein LTR70_006069 [Exophiala xenobiotica]
MSDDGLVHSTPPRYPYTIISGNACVIQGNVHGLVEGFLGRDAQPSRWTTRFRRQLQEDTRCQAEQLDHIHYSLQLATILIKDFDDVEPLLHSLRQSNNTVERYAKEFKVRQAILRSSVFNTLIGCVGAVAAKSMLRNDEHYAWTHATFVGILRVRCVADAKAIQAVLDLISLAVEAIGSIAQECLDLKHDEKKASLFLAFIVASPEISSSPKEGNTKPRLNVILPESGMIRHLKLLQAHTQDFRDLMKQPSPPAEGWQGPGRAFEVKTKVGKFRGVQEAAAQLYRAFGLACGQHDKHQACLRINATQARPDQVQFTLLFKPLPGKLVGIEFRESTDLRLTVESEMRATSVDTRPIGGGAKRRLDVQDNCEASQSACDSQSGRQWRSSSVPGSDVRENTSETSSDLEEHEAEVPLLPLKHPVVELRNFCHDRDFCAYIKKLAPLGAAKNTPVGCLNHPGASKHIVYLSMPSEIDLPAEHSHAQVWRNALSSMKEILQSSHEQRSISRRDLVRIAIQLATAVLQYHTTPWLESSWDSDHVLLERTGDAVQMLEPGSSDSYLDVSIQLSNDTAFSHHATSTRTMIRNPVLFKLGVMLLELAYARPLGEMCKPQDVDPHNEHNTDYYIAERLQKGVSIEMGPVFAEIVRKCIKCDFGHGEDLSTGPLQEGFYEEVVDKLEAIEAMLRDLGI